MKLSFLIQLMLLLSSVSALANYQKNLGKIASENGVGNGGDIIACYEEHKHPEYRTLDLYEAEDIHGFDIDIGNRRDPVANLINQLEKWRHHNPTYFDDLIEQVSEFMGEAQFFDNVVLRDISDSGHVVLPVGCRIQQVVIQRKPIFTGEKWFKVHNDYWQLMDGRNQAAMILHELIFRQGIGLGHLNSIRARYITGYLLSDKHRAQDSKDLLRLFIQGQLILDNQLYAFEGLNIYLGSPGGGETINGILRGYGVWQYKGGEQLIPLGIEDEYSETSLTIDVESMNPTYIYGVSDGELTIEFNQKAYLFHALHLYPNQNIRSIELYGHGYHEHDLEVSGLCSHSLNTAGVRFTQEGDVEILYSQDHEPNSTFCFRGCNDSPYFSEVEVGYPSTYGYTAQFHSSNGVAKLNDFYTSAFIPLGTGAVCGVFRDFKAHSLEGREDGSIKKIILGSDATFMDRSGTIPLNGTAGDTIEFDDEGWYISPEVEGSLN